MRTAAVLLAAAVVSPAAPIALAGASLDVPFFRGAAGSLYAGWDSFTVAVGGENLPTDASSDTGSTAFVRQTNPGSIIAGSGNLYSSFTVPNFQVHYTGNGNAVALATIQIRTQGLELDWANVTLDYFANGNAQGSLAGVRQELYREIQAAPGGAQSFDIISRFDFDLGGLLADGFVLNLPSTNMLISLDRVELDVSYIPAPGALGVLALSGLAIARRRR